MSKMVTRSIQFKPEVWEYILVQADRKNESAANYVRDCVELYITNMLKNYFHEATMKEIEEKNISEKEQLDYFYKRYETDVIKLIKKAKKFSDNIDKGVPENE